mmetsp:Transcript_25892/g.36917  ORF Transcript_25892/g.36917 Transcript_25892/m.36917 type:complete len:301 (+) Transcript_25892:65-967(+)
MKPSQTLFKDTVAAADYLAVMIEKEHTIYKCKCNGYLDPLEPTIITADDRMAVVDWCYSVVDHCHFSRESVAIAMDMVDRYLSVPSETGDEALRDQYKFQLLAVTALYVAIKINEAVAMSSATLSKITHGAYTVEEIEDMERTLLSGISWRCNAPNASQVGLSILSVISPYTNCSEVTWGFLMDEMKYLAELAVRDYYFSTKRASTLALATIFNAIGRIRGKERQELLQASLCILECFDFDKPKVVLMVSKKLHQLLEQENQGRDHDIEELMDSPEPEASKCIELRSPNIEMRRNPKLCI